MSSWIMITACRFVKINLHRVSIKTEPNHIFQSTVNNARFTFSKYKDILCVCGITKLYVFYSIVLLIISSGSHSNGFMTCLFQGLDQIWTQDIFHNKFLQTRRTATCVLHVRTDATIFKTLSIHLQTNLYIKLPVHCAVRIKPIKYD